MPISASSLAATASRRLSGVTPPPVLDLEAVRALSRMAAFLRGLASFSVIAASRIETRGRVLRRSFLSEEVFQARQPDSLYVESRLEREVRRVYFDGETVTVWSPDGQGLAGVYAQTKSRPTIAEALAAANADLNLNLPLADIFCWTDCDPPLVPLRRAERMGRAQVAGAEADQYLFGNTDFEWRIWIARGDAPVPLRAVIADLADPRGRRLTADLAWTLAPDLDPATFAFHPRPTDRSADRM